MRLRKPCSFEITSCSKTSHVKSGMMPTMERMRLALRLESVVVKAVGLVPQARPTQAIHRIGDVDEMLEELGGDVLVGRIVLGQSSAMANIVTQ